jgi:GT2 family glycosyltransferase
MSTLATVILCTHNPRRDYLSATLESLKLQSLDRASWELLVIDNTSEPPLAPTLDLTWHPAARVIREETLGLVHARCRGIQEAKDQLLVLVDDDNVLSPRYLQAALIIAQMHPEVGAFGGQITPRFEVDPPAWTEKYWPFLAIRAFESDRWSNVHDDYLALPCGAGMCVRAMVAQRWAELVKSDPIRAALGRSGQRLLSGEDSDLAWTACDMGLGVGVFTALQMTHLIAARRLHESYICALVEGTSYSNLRLLSTRGPLVPVNFPRQWMSLAKALLGGRRSFRLALAAYRGRRDAHRDIALETAAKTLAIRPIARPT